MCLALQGRLAIAVPVHAWRPPTRGIHGESTEIAIVSFLQHDSRHQSLGWRWRLMEGRWMPGVVEAYDVYLCPSPRGRVCVALTCGVAPDKGGEQSAAWQRAWTTCGYTMYNSIGDGEVAWGEMG
jgi:hypothetical protein